MPTPFLSGFLEGLAPDPDIKLWEWADTFRVLTSESSAEPGPWRTSRLPYAYAVMEALSIQDPCEKVVVMKGAQLGFSEIGNCWVGYLIHISPGPMMIVQASLETAKRFSRQRIDPMIEACAPLRERVSENKAKDASNTMTSKSFPGGLMLVCGANSAASLRSAPIRDLMLDEVDGYPQDLAGEGNPIALAEARTSTFPNKKIYEISTPTVEGRSNISAAYEDSSKQRFYLPCPRCDYKQVLVWGQVRWDDDDVENTTHYECIECQGKIFNHEKTEMLNGGVWIADKPEVTDVKGFHISSLYSPVGWRSWGSMAKMFVKATGPEGSAELLKTFYNLYLGETFREAGEVPDFHRLYERREEFPNYVLPRGASVITAGIDVQKDRVEIHVVAWSRDKQRWVLGYEIFYGDVEETEVWDVLADFIEREIPIAGSDMTTKISCFAIDNGYATNQVAKFARRFSKQRCFPIKGQSGLVQFVGLPRKGEVTVRGKKIPSGLKIWPLGIDHEKAALYRRLAFKMPEDGKAFTPGFIHFPKTCDLDYFRGLCSEELKTKVVNGFAKFYWEKIYDRNEKLDTMVYAYGAFAIKGYDRVGPEYWNSLEMDLGVKFDSLEVEVEEKIEGYAIKHVPQALEERSKVLAQAERPKPKRKSSFW